MKGNFYLRSFLSARSTSRTFWVLTGALGITLFLSVCQKTSGPAPLPESRWVIQRDTTLGPGTFKITQPIAVLRSVLQLRPGTILKFSPNAYLLVGDSGQLIAQGTPHDSIVLTGSPTWQGVILTSGEAGSKLAYTLLEKSTGTANLLLLSSYRTTLRHVTFRSASHFGLAIGAHAGPAWADSCRFKANQELPIYSHDIGALLHFGPTLTFQQNGDPRILIEGTSSTTESGTLSIRHYPLVFSEGWTIRSHIKVNPGSQIFLGKTLRVEGGFFNVLGATFYGPNRGDWPGLQVTGGKIRLDSTRVVRGGAGTDAALILEGGEMIVIRNSIIDSSMSNGVRVSTRIDTFLGNTIRYAAGYPITVSDPQFFPRIQNSTYEHNTQPYLRVSGIYVRDSNTWIDPGLPVLLSGLILEGPSAPVLTLSPGLTLVFFSSGELKVGFEPSGLIADGITFTALQDSTGWTGIVIGPQMTTVQIQNSVIEFGGHAKATADSGNITIYETTAPLIQNSTIRNSQAYGIYLVGSANDPAYRTWLLSQNEFANNPSGDIGPPARPRPLSP